MANKTLESLVPPLDLCKQIPQGKFADSALVWRYDRDIEQYIVCVRCPYSDKQIPAPTLEEIMEAMGNCGDVFLRKDGDGWMIMRELPGDGCDSEHAPDHPATAALRLWFDVKGRRDA